MDIHQSNSDLVANSLGIDVKLFHTDETIFHKDETIFYFIIFEKKIIFQ